MTKEGHLWFLDFKNLKLLKKLLCVQTTANLPIRRKNFKPLFTLISVRILLKQLDYSLFISMW